MLDVSIKDLLEAGVHFGHQTRRWNPKMAPYIFTARNGIHIIDLQKSLAKFTQAYQFIVELTSRGGKILFVGTKKQAQEVVSQEATRCGMFYVTNRWLGGTLTNFRTIKKSIDRLLELEKLGDPQQHPSLTKKELARLARKREKLEKFLGGIKNIERLPQALFLVDSKKERSAFHEARLMGMPIVAITDTNSDPTEVDYPIPGNDDAIRAIRLITTKIADACLEGKARYEEELLRATKEEEKVAVIELPTRPPGVEVEVRAKPKLEEHPLTNSEYMEDEQ